MSISTTASNVVINGIEPDITAIVFDDATSVVMGDFNGALNSVYLGLTASSLDVFVDTNGVIAVNETLTLSVPETETFTLGDKIEAVRMQQRSHHKIQINESETATVDNVTDMRFQVFKVGSKNPIISKSLGNGIAPNSNGWAINIAASEILIQGQVYREIFYVVSGVQYINTLGYSTINESLITV